MKKRMQKAQHIWSEQTEHTLHRLLWNTTSAFKVSPWLWPNVMWRHGPGKLSPPGSFPSFTIAHLQSFRILVVSINTILFKHCSDRHTVIQTRSNLLICWDAEVLKKILKVLSSLWLTECHAEIGWASKLRRQVAKLGSSVTLAVVRTLLHRRSCPRGLPLLSPRVPRLLPPRPLQTSRVTMVWPTEHETSELVSVSDNSTEFTFRAVSEPSRSFTVSGEGPYSQFHVYLPTYYV